MTHATALLAAFDHEMEALERVLERVPAGRWDWRPHARSRSLGELAGHLAAIPGWIGGMLEADAYDLARDDADGSARVGPASKDEMLALFHAHRDRARRAIARCSDAELEASWRLERAGRVLRTMPKTQVLRGFLLDHVIHHRGQLTVYLRLLDVPVPGLYGASADEPF